jgi:hypothetical protein
MKPHLAVLFPLALLCSRSWRALASFTVTAALTLVFALLAFGPGTFGAFLHNAGMAAGYVESGGAVLARLPTVFALIKLMTGSVALAYMAQGVSALLAAGAVCHVWGRESSCSLRAATLIGASLLVSPYLHDYDLVWYGLLIAWYCRHCMAYGWKRGEREWLCVLWLAPLAGVFVVTRLQFQFMPLISALTLCMLIRRVNFERRAPTVLQQDPGV